MGYFTCGSCYVAAPFMPTVLRRPGVSTVALVQALALLAGVALAAVGCGNKAAMPQPSGAYADAAASATDAVAQVAVTPVDAVDADAALGPDAGDAAANVLPAAMADFETFLSELEKAAPNAARAKRTCAIVTNDKQRVLFFAVWKVSPPPSAPVGEWKEAAEEYANTEYEIGDLCKDLDWDDDVAVLAKLRQRFERLVDLVKR